MVFSKKLLLVLAAIGSIVVSAKAGGSEDDAYSEANVCSESDISDWARDGVSAEDFPLIEQKSLKDYIEKYVQELAQKKGVKAPVVVTALEVKQFIPEKGSCSTAFDDDEERAEESLSRGAPPFVHELNLGLSLFNPSLTIAIIHHELGHAKFAEEHPEKNPNINPARDKEWNYVLVDGPKSNRFLQWVRGFQKRKELLYKDRYSEEQVADAAVPGNKGLLKAFRDHFKFQHGFGCFCRNADLVLADFTKKENPTRADKLSALKKIFQGFESIDFSKPMDEAKAKECDLFHREDNDEHPSGYRRAYYFDSRLKAVEAQDRARSVAKGELFSQFSSELTAGDML